MWFCPLASKYETAEIEIKKHMFCVLLRRPVVSALYGICSFIAMKCGYIFAVNSSVYTTRSSLNRRLPAEVPWKGHFHQVYTISLSCVVVRWSRVEPKFLLSTFFFPFFGLFAFLFCCFSINIYLTNCYLIKCKKQEETYCVSGAMSIFMHKQSQEP